MDSVRIDDLPMPLRLWQRLKANEIETVADLSAMTRKELLAIPGIGKACAMEAEQILAQYGLALRQPMVRAQWTYTDLNTMARLRRSGQTCTEIGKRYGISRTRVSELLKERNQAK